MSKFYEGPACEKGHKQGERMPKRDIKKQMAASIDATRGKVKCLIEDKISQSAFKVKQARADDIANWFIDSGMASNRAEQLAIKIVNGEMPHVKLIN